MISGLLPHSSATLFLEPRPIIDLAALYRGVRCTLPGWQGHLDEFLSGDVENAVSRFAKIFAKKLHFVANRCIGVHEAASGEKGQNTRFC